MRLFITHQFFFFLEQYCLLSHAASRIGKEVWWGEFVSWAFFGRIHKLSTTRQVPVTRRGRMETRRKSRSPRLFSTPPEKPDSDKPPIPTTKEPAGESLFPCASNLETTTTATTLAAGRVGGRGGDVLNAANLHAGTGQGTESGLGTGAGGLGTVTCRGISVSME